MDSIAVCKIVPRREKNDVKLQHVDQRCQDQHDETWDIMAVNFVPFAVSDSIESITVI